MSLGHMDEVVYGGPARDLPRNSDFYVLNNEDIGFVATLVDGTNDVYAFALPYPAYVDLDEKTIIVHKIKFWVQGQVKIGEPAANYQSLVVFISMLDKEFPADWGLVGADAVDEEIKCLIADNICFGHLAGNVTATASIEGSYRQGSHQCGVWYPPNRDGLDAFTPIYLQFVNNSQQITLGTNAVAHDQDFDKFERVYMRVWFTTRRLTASEKDMRKAYKYLIMDA